MKINISFLTSTLLSAGFLLSFLTACGAPSSVPATQAPVIENTALPTQPVQFTPIPSFTAE
ncbi:MAG: hypothetical protein Q7J80_00770, partial [Anaerolineales bacterium]|nr:hypothetical protein [Anaerolineales bacterium]